MNSFLLLFLIPALVVYFAWRVAKGQKVVVIAPGCRDRSHRYGLSKAKDFLDLPCVRIGGHRHRYVARVGLPAGFQGDPSNNGQNSLAMAACPEAAWPGALLKVEERGPFVKSITSPFLSLGGKSGARLEASNLEMAALYGLPAPSWIAYGAHRGRPFLLIAEITGALPLIQATTSPYRALRFAIWMGKTLARMHALGVVHGDLFLKHVLFDPEKGEPVFVDWQRARLVQAPRLADRLRDLAALAYSLPKSSEPFKVSQTGSNRLGRNILSKALGAYLLESEKYPNPGALLPDFAKLWKLLEREVDQLAARHGPRGSQAQQGHRAGHDWVVVRRPECRNFAWTTLGIEKTEAVEQSMAWMRRAAARLSENGRAKGISWVRGVDGHIVAGIAWWQGKRSSWAFRLGRRPLAPEIALAGRLFHLDNLGIEAAKVLARGVFLVPGSKTRVHFLVIQPKRPGMSIGLWLRKTAFQPGSRRKAIIENLGRSLAQLHAKGVQLFTAKGSKKGSNGLLVPFSIHPARSMVWLQCPSESSFAGKNLVGGREVWADLGCLMRRLIGLGASPLETSWLQQAYLTTALPGAGKTETIFEVEKAKPVLVAAMASVGDSNKGGAIQKEGFEPKSAETPRNGRTIVDQGRSLPPIHNGRRTWAHDDWVRFVGPNWADSIMDIKLTDRFHAKQGRSVGRWEIQEPDRTGEKLIVYLKRHNILPRLDGLLARLIPRWPRSPALQEWQHLKWALELGIQVPRGLAVAEFHGPGTKLQSCLVVGELTGMIPLHEAVPLASHRIEPDKFHLWKRGLLREMARIGRLLHDRRYFHKDFYLCHFYIKESDTWRTPPSWFNQVVLIDLHRLAKHRLFWPMYQIKDLAQLLFSSEVEGVRAQDRIAFWRAYQGLWAGDGRGQGWYQRIVARIIRWKWQRYRNHNLKLVHGVRRAA